MPVSSPSRSHPWDLMNGITPGDPPALVKSSVLVQKKHAAAVMDQRIRPVHLNASERGKRGLVGVSLLSCKGALFICSCANEQYLSVSPQQRTSLEPPQAALGRRTGWRRPGTPARTCRRPSGPASRRRTSRCTRSTWGWCSTGRSGTGPRCRSVAYHPCTISRRRTSPCPSSAGGL
eukprot:9222517-Pyramimonas_sp.AAC.1